jgi:hypothetical protein
MLLKNAWLNSSTVDLNHADNKSVKHVSKRGFYCGGGEGEEDGGGGG